ncbi:MULTISPECIES: VanZ family protein [unclassified Microbacterium]|uniref:VanZ family protein n=1 Tax=unclassified Microbacterium TaxID=2609290 RepID=UPI003019B229
MGNEAYSAAVAIGLGVLVGTALFVPFVALSYRRRGRLTLGRSLLWAAALVYFLALNVLLFLPLGFFLRVLGGRGILVALLVGFGVSLVVETTQLTGVWGLYPCAYRVFDVDDLLTNTVGAVLGSLLALVVPRRMRGPAVVDGAARARPVTRRRRLLGMVCDVLG